MDVSGWIIIITIIIVVILMNSKFKERGELLVSDFTQITLKVPATFEYELGLFCFQEAE